MKTSCNVHPPGTWNHQWQKDVSWHVVSGERSKRGDFYQVLSEEQQVEPAKVWLSGSHRRWLQWLSLLRKDSESLRLQHTSYDIRLCYISWCSTTQLLKHNPIVTCCPVAPHRHSKGCSAPTSCFLLITQMGEDVQGKQFWLSATVQHQLVLHTLQML